MSDDDQIPDPLAGFDQALRQLVDVAKAARAYHVALVEQGFTVEQALELTVAFQTTLMRMGNES